MQNDQQKRTMIAKRIIIVVVVLVAVFAIGVGVALLLKNVSNLAKTQSSTTDDTPSATPGAPSAASIISGYIDPSTIRLFTAQYQLQQDTTAPSRISYTADGQEYEVSLSTSSYAMFFAKDGAAHNDAKAVETATDSYMSSKGFEKATNKKSASITTYTNKGSVCQLTSMPTTKPAYYLMACADKADVDKEYATIENLLDIYRKSNQLVDFTKAITSTVTSDNKTMTTISLTTTPDTHPVLLFASVDNQWAYIGNVGGGNAATSNGKYSLTAQVQTAIHDQKYGDFLVNNLQ